MRGSIGMPSFISSMAVQKKRSVIPPSQGPLSTRTIASQKVGNRSERTKENGFHDKSVSQTKRTTCSVNKSARICNSVSRVAAANNGPNVDERLKAARERREEQQKLIVSREHSRLEREQRARQYYEQQLQERKKKLRQQRQREERRRAAVEEKRKQRLKEEKERCESAVRRTLEKSLKAHQHLNQNPRGRKPTKYAPRRLPLTTWEKNLVNRLLTPTCSYLARSRSTGCLSGGEVSYHSMNISTPRSQQQANSLVQQRVSSAPPGSRSISVAQIKAARQPNVFLRNSDKRSSFANTRLKTGAGTLSRNISPSPERSPQRAVSKQSSPLIPELPSVPEEDLSICAAVSPGNTRPVKRLDKEESTQALCPNLPEKLANREAPFRTEGDGSPAKVHPHAASQPPEIFLRPSAGTSDPEEASRLLAERRREARLQREKEQQERVQKEENERRIKDELERRKAEERARMEAEAQRLIEQKRIREEEELRRAEEERAQAIKEAALLQKQREEELAKERARSEQIKQEREIVAQKEEAARQARKKRLEEIMRRTRRTDSPDTHCMPEKIIPNEGGPNENRVPSHNGTMEDVVKLSVASKPTQLGLKNEDDVIPVVAFKERKSLRALSGLEEIQTHQRAEVI